MTDGTDRMLLLKLARDAMVAHVSGAARPCPELAGVLSRASGAFVTIHRAGELRGCIGYTEADEPLGTVVVRCAVAACSADPRFAAVSVAELALLELELSLLGPLEPIGGWSDVEIGRHGLVVEMGWRRGLLLPQVASQWNWDGEAFLAQTCFKAGLPQDAWKRGAKIWRFEAEVFSEQSGSAVC